MSAPPASPETDRPRGETWRRAVLRARQLHLLRFGIVALLGVLLGIGLGRGTAPDDRQEARVAVETSVMPLALDADGIWTSSAGEDRPPVAEGIPLVESGQRLDRVSDWTEDWVRAYDNVLIRLEGLDLPASARPVQRQFISAITLSRDAVEVLEQAVEADTEAAREALVGEALRLRQRAEHLTQSARASARDLSGTAGEVSRPPSLPSPEAGDEEASGPPVDR